MGYISLPSIFNSITGITSYYCVVLNMVILYDAIKTIQNGVFAFVLKKEQKPVLFFEKNKKKTDCFAKKTDGLGFSQPCH